MMRFKRLLRLTFVLVVTFTSCNTNVDIPTVPTDKPLDPTQKYIHFDAEVSTRGAMIEGTVLKDAFNVLGYQYPSNWVTAKAMATPNVFNNNPETVKYENSVYTYDNDTPIPWSANNYSFFGYYPLSNNSNNSNNNIALSDEGDPYITYTLPTSSDPRELIDIMTASYIDTNMASSASVALEFHHRLAAIDVAARNYYEYDHDNISSTTNKAVTIEIKELTVKLSNVVNNSAKIYLNTDSILKGIPSPSAIDLTYPLVGGSNEWELPTFDILPNTTTDRAMRLVTTQSGENATSILLIPQTELLEAQLVMKYKKKYEDESGWKYIEEDTDDYEFDSTLDIDFTKAIIEGSRYFIEMTFTSDAVSINIVSADEWDAPTEDITHEFN